MILIVYENIKKKKKKRYWNKKVKRQKNKKEEYKHEVGFFFLIEKKNKQNMENKALMPRILDCIKRRDGDATRKNTFVRKTK